MIDQTWKIGDCQNLMKEMEPNSVDLILTDPPYGYSFMGKDWDRAVPTVDLWQEALRILKPGAFAFIMSAPRQDVLSHNLVNLSDAGFDTSFTSIYWTYASGFPKASNIGKMVDKRLGAEREIIGKSDVLKGRKSDNHENWGQHIGNLENNKYKDGYPITELSTLQAKTLNGSYGGFQPKPAVEVIMVVMKPLSEKTYVDQAMINQKGITWLDDGRIPYQSDNDKKSADPGSMKYNPEKRSNNGVGGIYNNTILKNNSGKYEQPKGRFPANLLVSDNVLDDSGSFSRYFDLDAWWNDQIKYLPKEVKKTFPFIITPKASKNDKGNMDIDNSDKYNGKFPCSKADKNKNTHPTVKPVKLFTYLITIGSREGDLVLDPFLGSGTTLQSGRLTNRNVMGFELDPQWESLYSNRAMKNTPNLLSFG